MSEETEMISDLGGPFAEVDEKERIKIREKISNLSFEDLLKLKDEIGSKCYMETVLGVSKNKTNTIKRANKNRPREISSKVKPTFRYHEEKVAPTISHPKMNIARDPRFDPLCGEFNAENFRENYKFVNDMRIKEKKELEKELKSTADPERQKSIKYILQRMNNQIREEENRNKEKQKIIEEKREIKEKYKKGEKPVFKKKHVKKLENLIEQYEDLKKTNRLQKHIQKRNKKLSAKTKKRNVILDM